MVSMIPLKTKQTSRFYLYLPCLLVMAVSFLTGCEARLDLKGVESTLDQSIRRTDQLMSIQQLSDGTKLIFGNNGLVLKQGIGAEGWTRSELNVGLVKPNFIDSAVCPNGLAVALAYQNQIWLSDDQGDSWSLHELPTAEEVQAVDCTPKGDIWVVGSFSTLLVSKDGGDNWSESTMDEDSMLTAVTFSSAEKGFALGEFGLLLVTEDGGENWQMMNPVSEEFYPLSAYFQDSKTGWVGGLQGLIMQTNDGGVSWQRQKAASETPIYSFISNNEAVFATGDRGTVLTLKKGEWVRVPSPDNPTYYRSGISTEDHSLLIVGGWGVLLELDPTTHALAAYE